jgi:CheY-specific phosphatase CheX
MQTDYLKPFVDATIKLMSTMLNLSCEKTEDAVPGEDIFISGTVRLTGPAQGQVAMSFPKETATKLVAKMLNMHDDEISEEVMHDGVGEMVNIVAGNAMTALSDTEYQFSLTVPLIVAGHSHTLALYRGGERDTCGLETELGDFNLVLWLVVATE